MPLLVRTGPERRYLIAIIPTYLSIRGLATPCTARLAQASYLVKRTIEERAGPRRAGLSDTPPVIAGGLRENSEYP